MTPSLTFRRVLPRDAAQLGAGKIFSQDKTYLFSSTVIIHTSDAVILYYTICTRASLFHTNSYLINGTSLGQTLLFILITFIKYFSFYSILHVANTSAALCCIKVNFNSFVCSRSIGWVACLPEHYFLIVMADFVSTCVMHTLLQL